MSILASPSRVHTRKPTRSRLQGFLRSLGSCPEPPPLSADADFSPRSLPGFADDEESVAFDGSYISLRVRVAAAGYIGGSDAMWIRDFLHRLPLVALGSGSHRGSLCRRDRLRHFHGWEVDPLLRLDAAAFLFIEEGHFW
ncbi:hypothetical protein Bca4012_006702 [Brassica carinata]